MCDNERSDLRSIPEGYPFLKASCRLPAKVEINEGIAELWLQVLTFHE